MQKEEDQFRKENGDTGIAKLAGQELGILLMSKKPDKDFYDIVGKVEAAISLLPMPDLYTTRRLELWLLN